MPVKHADIMAKRQRKIVQCFIYPFELNGCNYRLPWRLFKRRVCLTHFLIDFLFIHVLTEKKRLFTLIVLSVTLQSVCSFPDPVVLQTP